MGFFSDVIDSMRLHSDPEDDYLDPDEEDYSDPPRGGIFRRKREEDDYDDQPEQDNRPKLFGSRKAVPTPVRRTMEVSLVKPNAVEDAREITDYLLEGKAVVLNMEGIHTEVAQRIIDFTSGATYSMDGKLQKISNNIFIATPSSVDLSGDFPDLMSSGSFDVSGLNIHL